MAFIANYIQDRALGVVATAIPYAGGIAGNAVNGVGQLIEAGGTTVGNGVAGFIAKGGNAINSVAEYMMDSTATQDGRVRRTTAVKPSAAAHSTANISATAGGAKKVVGGGGKGAVVGGGQKVLANGVKTISAASRPGTTNGAVVKKKKSTGAVARVGSGAKPVQKALPAVKPAAGAAQSGKVKISAASRPGGAVSKTSGAKQAGVAVKKPAGSSVGGAGKVKVSAQSKPKSASAAR